MNDHQTTAREACTAEDLAHALDNTTPYPIELDSRVCRFMAERLLEMVHVARRAEHVVWEYEAPPSPGPEPEACPAAPRDALSAPQTAEPPAPGPEQHPGGENGPHTGTQSREPHRCGNCEGIDPDTCLMNPDRPCTGECDPTTGAYTHRPHCPDNPDAVEERRQRYARALRTTPATGHTHKPGQEKWDHHPAPGSEGGHRYTYTCALCRGDIDALATAVLAVADAEQDEVRAERDRYAAAVGRAEQYAHTLRHGDAMGLLSALDAPQAGDDTTGGAQ